MSFLFPKKPQPTPVSRMPTSDDELSRLASARQRQTSLMRGGRSSTILSRRNGTEAGVSSYANTALGAAS